VLYKRHLDVARRVATSWAASRAERDDAIAEAFTRVLRMLRSGAGPDALFRPYLVATMRNAVISWRRQDSAVSAVADVPEPRDSATTVEDDPMDQRLQTSLAVHAFATLPQRWRMVLWHTAIEDESPAQVATLLGMTPNGVSALAYRARQGLRKAYLAQSR
jgi:RNA polymerase sigma factor (sigma-70 family)